jgi:hypothetical protein
VVLQALRNFGGEGWICLTDRVEAISNGEAIPEGLPLSAEVCDGQGRALHVRQAHDGWWLLRYQESDNDGTPVLVFDKIYESSRPGGDWAMRYRVYWKQQEEGGLSVWRPMVGVFDGWQRR